ncbi:MAG: RluA family pseudouridine synthase [Lachnospiraceae bacterium]|nr:RluA family pseudouridine synthase [Lachnospiraceae bacterium]
MDQNGTRILSWRVPPFGAVPGNRNASTIRAAGAGCTQTIEAFLRAKGCSHHVLTQLKRTDHGILQNGQWAYTNQPVHAGDAITIHLVETEPSEQILPVPLPLQIVYEDEDILIADKPCDMPVHPSAGNYENTLANAVMYYYTSRNIPFAFRCVTRLDRDTTGLVLIAKNSLSGAILSDMAARRQIHREYLAITEGMLPEAGTIRAPIARQEGSPLMRCIDEVRGERAVTHYRRLCAYTGPYCFSLASIRLETGRTHQIRVHMKSIGHPLPGDFLYNPDSVCALTPRQMLHSHRISFVHPITGKELTFESEMPKDMQLMLCSLNKLCV